MLRSFSHLKNLVAKGEALRVLEQGAARPFSDWPDPEVPSDAAGVYAVWRGHDFIYVGMSGAALPLRI